MATTPEPGDRPTAPRQGGGRSLPEPPSRRYGASADPGASPRAPVGGRAALAGPALRATLVAAAGAVALVLVGAILASTAGLLFVAGVTGAAAGFVLARAAAPSDPGVVPTERRTVARLAVALALAAVAVAAVATWLVALGEGGTLGLFDYLLTTFGPFVPAEAVIAAVAAWWGASTGPIRG